MGSIYVHFRSKEGLYLALVERALEVQERYMEEAFKPTLVARAAAVRRRLGVLRFYLDHPGYFRILAFPHVDARPDGRALVRGAATGRAGRGAACGGSPSIIELGVKTGAARPVDPYRAAKFMWGAWTGVIALNLRPDRLRLDDEELRAVLEEGRRIVAEGIAWDGPAAARRHACGPSSTWHPPEIDIPC